MLVRLICFLCVFLAIAFYTLAERKLLSYAQLRVGPNKVRVAGIFQPIADACKLLTKAFFKPDCSNSFTFQVAPAASLLLAFLIYLLVVDYFFQGNSQLSLILFLFVISIGVFPRTLAG